MNLASWTPTARRLVCIVWATAFAACASTGAAPQSMPMLASAMDAPANSVARMTNPDANRVQLNPNHLVLPEATASASGAMRDFIAAATHAVRQAYEEDNDDPSVLLALQENLRDNAELKPLASVWRDILQSALARSENLQAVGPVLRPLREAMQQATLEVSSQTIQGLDISLCENAFGSPIGRNSAIDGIVATFARIGTFNLGQVREACVNSAQAALQKTRLPGHPATQRITRLVRRLYAQAHLGGDVRQVAVLKSWHRDRAKHALTLRAAIGIAQGNGEGTQGCTMARIAVIRSLRGNTPPALVELGTREPILCSQLR